MQPMLKTAVDAVRTAGLVINRAALNLDQIKVSQKGLQDLVTEIDQDVEQILRERLLVKREPGSRFYDGDIVRLERVAQER
mgnify:CR=1 FL=1